MIVGDRRKNWEYMYMYEYKDQFKHGEKILLICR